MRSRISLLIPGSLTEGVADKRAKTLKIGQIGRAAAIFGVEEVVVYDEASLNDGRFIEKVLAYQATAPYLRKRLFALSEELEFAGLLPPLNTQAHLAGHRATPGEYREAVGVRGGVEAGLERAANLRGAAPSGRFFVKVVEASSVGVIVEQVPSGEWAGFTTRRAKDLGEALSGFKLKIGTSRLGLDVREGFKDFPAGRTAIAFGPPSKGLEEILTTERRDLSTFDLYLNTVPGQRTQTVRTEEAVLATLSVLNLHAPRG
ncbi:MAG: methylase [Euryarchaeota archaeon]|nr:methylase [Euryarchaeota archaeon]